MKVAITNHATVKSSQPSATLMPSSRQYDTVRYPDPSQDTANSKVVPLLIVGGLFLVLLIKLYIASNLDLFTDEAFYWQESQDLAISYSDHPPVTAYLVALGTLLFGDTTLGVRSIFVLLSMLIPVAMYYLAVPLVNNKREALFCSGLSMAIPLVGAMGVLAMPDVPLILVIIAGIATFERAIRTGDNRYWIYTGILGAIGLCTHFRFFVSIFAAFVFLIITAKGREQWKGRGVWMAIAIMLLGLLPVIIFNVIHDFIPLRYQFLNRHPWEFQDKWADYIADQAFFTTPLIFFSMMAGLVVVIYKAAKGHPGMSLLAIFSISYLGIFIALSPWMDHHHTNVHWPLPGYLPLIVVLPWVLTGVYRGLQKVVRYRPISVLVTSIIPMSGIVGTFLVFGYALMAINAEYFYKDYPLAKFTFRITGWTDMAADARYLVHDSSNKHGVMVTDHYRTGAELDFLLGDTINIFSVNRESLVDDGRAFQYELWGKDANALMTKHAGENAIIVIDEANLDKSNRKSIIDRMCRIFSKVEPLEPQLILGGLKIYKYYRGINIQPVLSNHADIKNTRKAENCPYSATLTLGSPRKKTQIEGPIRFYGWAYNDAGGVSSIDILVDGKIHGRATYGMPRPGVYETFPESTDPNHPNVGFKYTIPAGQLSPGWHWVAVRATSNNGAVDIYSPRRIYVGAEEGV